MSYLSVCICSVRSTCFLDIPPHFYSNPHAVLYIPSSIHISSSLLFTQTFPLYTQQLIVKSSATSISSIILLKVLAVIEICFFPRDIVSPVVFSKNNTFLSNTSYTMHPGWGHLIVISRSFYKQQIPLKPMESDFSTYSSILIQWLIFFQASLLLPLKILALVHCFSSHHFSSPHSK